jgi:hypothetical protein
MNLIMDSTRVNGKNCITFIKRSNQKEHILVFRGKRCSSMAI